MLAALYARAPNYAPAHVCAHGRARVLEYKPLNTHEQHGLAVSYGGVTVGSQRVNVGFWSRVARRDVAAWRDVVGSQRVNVGFWPRVAWRGGAGRAGGRDRKRRACAAAWRGVAWEGARACVGGRGRAGDGQGGRAGPAGKSKTRSSETRSRSRL